LSQYESNYIKEADETNLINITNFALKHNKDMRAGTYITNNRIIHKYEQLVYATKRKYTDGEITYDEFTQAINFF
jgi:hypothetical protein